MNSDQSAIGNLKAFLGGTVNTEQIKRLTPDASAREYFRIPWKGGTAVACVYPQAIDDTLPQIDVTNLFLEAGLPVAQIFRVDFPLGIVIQEDFGDELLRDRLVNEQNPNVLIETAVGLIATIQSATKLSFELGSIASKLKFDVEKLLWELDFFVNHYFVSLKQRQLSPAMQAALNAEFREISRDLEYLANVLTHRDFHSANLMISGEELKIIDHQDARIGPATYDLVSLLLDRIEEVPSSQHIALFKAKLESERAKLGLPGIRDIDTEFELVTIQRCLKAIGTFSNQAANFGKPGYIKFIKPMFRAVANACETLDRFSAIRTIAGSEAG